MWSTPDGERILQGAEAALVREALAVVVDMVRDDAEGHREFGAPPFDDLQPNQRLALLAYVGSALLYEDQPAPELTAAAEATVGAVYEAVRLSVEMEIDQASEGHGKPIWRERVLAACRQRGIEELPDAQSEDFDDWDVLVDSLAGSVLWDEDWRDSESLMDADPKAGRAVKELLGIDENYYTAVPPDPTDGEMEGIWARLRDLTHGGS